MSGTALRWICGFTLGITLTLVNGIAADQPTPVSSSKVLRDGQHDFDFEIGIWNTTVKRLERPLSGQEKWLEYKGVTTDRKVWDGKSNMLELIMDGPTGHFEGASWRLYSPEGHQWSLNFANSRTGLLSTPTIGRFENGKGEFYGQDTFDGRTILVRFEITHQSGDAAHFEQAFSDDGGKTWQVNWIADDRRTERKSM
jgi:YD repeat-containing protein